MNGNLNIELTTYKNKFKNTIMKQTGMTDEECEYSSELQDIIQNDLFDKGFDENEAYEIATYNLSKYTVYKFLAYVYSLYNEYNSIDELKDIINDSNSNIDEFTDEDLEQIFKYSTQLY